MSILDLSLTEIYSAKSPAFKYDDNWSYCVRPPRCRQGWKIYVSATCDTMNNSLAAIDDYLNRTNTPFKHVRNRGTLEKLNAGLSGYSQIGKCIVIYAEKKPYQIMLNLRELLAPFRGMAPNIPFAMPLGGELPLFYRYGSYRDFSIRLNGKKLEDRRDSKDQAIPTNQIDIFANLIDSSDVDPAADKFFERFPVFLTLSQSGKSGVFLAIDTHDPELSPVAVKVGYKNGAMNASCVDGRSYVEREITNYRRLSTIPLGRRCPRVIGSLVTDKTSILVTKYILGVDLAAAARAHSLRVEHLSSAWNIIEEFHREGYILTDPKLGNFVVGPDGREIYAIDLEMLRITGENSFVMKRTFHVKLDHKVREDVADKVHFIASIILSGRSSLREQMGMIDIGSVVSAIDDCADGDVAMWARHHLAQLKTSIE